MTDESGPPDEGAGKPARPWGVWGQTFTETEFVGIARSEGAHWVLDRYGWPVRITVKPTPIPELFGHVPSDKMIAVAEMIAGGTPPPWLAPRLSMQFLGRMVANARDAEAKQTGRADVREMLARAAKTASAMMAILDDPILMSFINARSPIDDADLHKLWKLLERFAERASQARDKTLTKGGKPYEEWAYPTARSAEQLCAIIVREAWILAGPEPLPNPTDTRLVRAGEAYWIATGGAPHQDEDGIAPGYTNLKGRPFLSVWRECFERADDQSIERRRIIWILTGCKGPIPTR